MSFPQSLSSTKRLSLVPQPEVVSCRPVWLETKKLSWPGFRRRHKKFIPRNENRLNLYDDYVEKWFKVVSRFRILRIIARCCGGGGRRGGKTKKRAGAGYEAGRCFMTLDVGEKKISI